MGKERIRTDDTYNKDERGNPGGGNGYPLEPWGIMLLGIILKTGRFQNLCQKITWQTVGWPS